MLVWKAILSMVAVISPIFEDEARIPSIVLTTSPITRPPSDAVWAL